MKGVNCRNIERFVANRNRDVHKQLQGVTRSTLTIESILGTNSQALKGSVVFALSAQEVIYYSSEYFIVHNLLTKENSAIRKEGCNNHSTLYIDHFQTQINTDIIFTIEQSAAHLFLGQLQITGSITESNGTNSQSEMKNCNWRLSKLTSKCGYAIDHVCYNSSKQYLYLLASKVKEDKTQRCLWVYDLKRECMIMSPEIKASVGKAEISSIWVTDDPSEIYLMGVNYFRFWTINFNEKTIKQSNYRNIERCLADKTILRLFNSHTSGGKLLNIVTNTHIILLKRNELLSCEKPPNHSLKKVKSKDNIEVQLQNSLNQIYRMKFLFDEEDGEPKQTDQYQITPDQIQVDNDQFCCASELWMGDGGQCIVIATKGGNLLTFSVGGGQMKLLSELVARKPHRFDFITASRRGDVVLLSEKRCQQLYIINKYLLSSEQSQEELKPFWGMGHVGKETVLSIDSPAVHQRVCTLGQHSTLRLWSFKGRERRILFEEHLQNQPSQITMHPCGLLVAINYAYEIKLMSLLPTGLYQVISVKTNYNSIGLQYSECGNYLVSNEQNLLVIYNPFTLKTMGYLQLPQLKSSIVEFQISPEGSHIGFHTSDFNFYLFPLDINTNLKFETLLPSHCQREQYTCFYFQTGLPRNARSPLQTIEESLFIGCTKNKYMVLYRQLGKELVIEFPVQDCYVTSLCVADGWLFAATSKGSIRVYRWPILEEECELQIANVEQKAVRLKHPIFDEYFFWTDGKRITKMHKLAFTNKLLVARQGGILGIVRYERSSGERTEQLGERKKLVQIVNETFFITKNESEKRNRLIEKTEGDILKVQNQIAKEKSIMERKYREECNQIQKNYQEKTDINAEEKADYLDKLKTEINHLTETTVNKKKQVDRQNAATMGLYTDKLQYQKNRNEQIERKTVEGVTQHKLRIAQQIEAHKEKIRSIKNQYREKIAFMRRQFEAMVSEDYPYLISKPNIKQLSVKPNHSSLRVSLEVNPEPHRLSDFLQGEVLDDEINTLGSKVEQVRQSNAELKEALSQIKLKVRVAQADDEQLQKEFQRCLQDYNSSRFSNLSLHSQVLKMRTQLIERKEIMDNKQEIINMAFQERQKLQNYKSLVKGALTKLQDHKENTHHLFVSKENELSLIFSQLSSSFRALEKLKREERQIEGMLAVLSKQKQSGDKRLELAVVRLKQLKRYLLFEGLTEDAQQKRMYLQQQNLLTVINFYKKRMSMQFMKEKKNKLLKKSAVNLVLKQNKNLLQECNQLREETIDCQHEIKNVGGKLGEAHRIISIESKLKDQRGEVDQQRSKLEAIRTLFTNQMVSYNQNVGYEDEMI